jgi:hypothetical protein
VLTPSKAAQGFSFNCIRDKSHETQRSDKKRKRKTRRLAHTLKQNCSRLIRSEEQQRSNDNARGVTVTNALNSDPKIVKFAGKT